MESIGARLKKKRLEQGISIEDVHNKTKIHLDILKSIEDDSLVNFNPIYIKGFLKLYCQSLGVNPEDYIPCYKEVKAAVRPAESVKEKHPGYLKQSVKAGHSFKARWILVLVSLIVFVSLVIGMIYLVKSAASKVSAWSKKNKSVAQLKVKKTKKITAAIKLVSAKPVISDKKNEIIAVNSNIESELRVALHALEDSWVQAKIDGKTVFQSILKKGRDENWKAKDKIELILGSAGGVRLEVNGKVIPSLGRKDQVLKDVVITRSGLKTGR